MLFTYVRTVHWNLLYVVFILFFTKSSDACKGTCGIVCITLYVKQEDSKHTFVYDRMPHSGRVLTSSSLLDHAEFRSRVTVYCSSHLSNHILHIRKTTANFFTRTFIFFYK